MTTNNSSNYTTSNHKVIIGSSNNLISSMSSGTSGQIAQSTGATDPSWSTATYPSTAGTSGFVVTSDGTNFSSASFSTSGLSLLTGNLTNSQIKNLHATPIQVIAAPASGKMIFPIFFSGSMQYGGTNAFTAAASQTIEFYWGTSVTAGKLLTNGGITSTSSTLLWTEGQTGGTGTEQNYSSLNGAALNLYNPIATEISGNAANNNTISYFLVYTIMTV